MKTHFITFLQIPARPFIFYFNFNEKKSKTVSNFKGNIFDNLFKYVQKEIN